MDKLKLQKFCRYIDHKIGWFAENIIEDIMCGKAKDVTDNFWWNHMAAFRIVRDMLERYDLWDTGEKF